MSLLFLHVSIESVLICQYLIELEVVALNMIYWCLLQIMQDDDISHGIQKDISLSKAM